MRLDHLLSKRDEVKVVLLLSCQGTDRAFVSERRRGQRSPGRSCGAASNIFCVAKDNISGADALMGHTRTHPEHDG